MQTMLHMRFSIMPIHKSILLSCNPEKATTTFPVAYISSCVNNIDNAFATFDTYRAKIQNYCKLSDRHIVTQYVVKQE